MKRYEVTNTDETKYLVVEGTSIDQEADLIATIYSCSDDHCLAGRSFDEITESSPIMAWLEEQHFEMTECAEAVIEFTIDAALIVCDMTVGKAVIHELNRWEEAHDLKN